MYEKPTSPRSIGGVIDDAINLYKASFRHVWLFGLLTMLVSVAYVATVFPLMPRTVDPTHPFAMYRSGPVLLLFLFNLLFYVWSNCAMTASIYAVASGESMSFGMACVRGLSSLPMAVVGAIIWTVAIAVGLILLIIPGVYIWQRWLLWVVPLAAEQRGVGESLGISWRLVGGNWWRTATITTVFLIIMFIAIVVLGMVAALIVPKIGGLSAATMAVSISGVSALSRLVTAPIIPTVAVAIYKDLELRKGGADLAARVGSLNPA